MILSQIAEKAIGYSSSINAAFKELLTGKSYGAETQGPAAPEAKPQLTHEQKAKQDKIMQQFYPNYMVDSGIRPGSHPMYLTIDKDHPSLLHTVQYGQSWMYSIGDAAIVHCFTQNGKYYKVRLGLDKNKDEVHGFYADPGTFIAIETAENNGVGFSQISTELPDGNDGAIYVPGKDKLLQLFPAQRDIIERFSVKE
ncbi:cupin domain-containing protein [Lactobacillus helveticus]|uniref:cupin domain-containing protein n=1 Tax=Lactobacillus helveticus TaxID=1587 RepID=UPI0005D9612B|nr:cupin domain-containing protein [Lactobacillus helveticus]AJY61440.1 Sir2 silent information regulator family NAD-dependent deacetylase [Lactobacillus helveticus]